MPKFVTCLNCMDGRAQQPVIDWLKEHYGAEYIDMITEAGMDGHLVANTHLPDHLNHKIGISIEKHGSQFIFVTGHHDCGGHSVSEDDHRRDVLQAVDKIKAAWPNCAVAGLWVTDKWEVEEIIRK